MSDDCLFCKIVAGEIPSDIVYADDHAVAFRDIAPAAPVHVLVVPRRHIRDAASIETDDDVMGAMLAAARAVAAAEGVDASGYRLVLNVGRDAGQTVFHLHMHVLGGRPLGPVAS